MWPYNTEILCLNLNSTFLAHSTMSITLESNKKFLPVRFDKILWNQSNPLPWYILSLSFTYNLIFYLCCWWALPILVVVHLKKPWIVVTCAAIVSSWHLHHTVLYYELSVHMPTLSLWGVLVNPYYTLLYIPCHDWQRASSHIYTCLQVLNLRLQFKPETLIPW